MRFFTSFTAVLLLFSPAICSAATRTITIDTADPTTLVEELIDHPYITYSLASVISEECRRIKWLDAFLHRVNATNLPVIVGPQGKVLNLTAIVLAAEADLDKLTSNKTLVAICRKAAEIVDVCSPLVDRPRPLPRESAILSILEGLATRTAVTVALPSRTVVVSLDPTATAAVHGNGTLLRLCEAWVLGLRRNLTEVDAALVAADAVATSTASGSGSAASSTSVAGAVTTATTASATTSAAAATTTSRSSAVPGAIVSGGLFGALAIFFVLLL